MNILLIKTRVSLDIIIIRNFPGAYYTDVIFIEKKKKPISSYIYFKCNDKLRRMLIFKSHI